MLLGGTLGLSGCSGSPADEIDYAVDGTLITYIINTVVGAASGGPQVFARVRRVSTTTDPTGRSSAITTSAPCRWSGGRRWCSTM